MTIAFWFTSNQTGTCSADLCDVMMKPFTVYLNSKKYKYYPVKLLFFDLAHLPETLSKMEKNVLFLHLCYLIIFTSKCSIWCHSTFHMLHKKLGTNQ